jgi:hypothetical protein
MHMDLPMQNEPTSLINLSPRKLQILQTNDVEGQLVPDRKSTSTFDLSCVGSTFYPFLCKWVSFVTVLVNALCESYHVQSTHLSGVRTLLQQRL